jgi:hypothetical protein
VRAGYGIRPAACQPVRRVRAAAARGIDALATLLVCYARITRLFTDKEIAHEQWGARRAASAARTTRPCRQQMSPLTGR